MLLHELVAKIECVVTEEAPNNSGVKKYPRKNVSARTVDGRMCGMILPPTPRGLSRLSV